MLLVPCCTCVHRNPDSFRVGCRGCSHTVCTHCGYEDTSQGPSQYRFFCVHCYEPEWQAVRAGSMGSSEVASSALFLACGGGDPVCCESRRRYICRGYQRWQTRPANVAPKAFALFCSNHGPRAQPLRAASTQQTAIQMPDKVSRRCTQDSKTKEKKTTEQPVEVASECDQRR